MPVCDKRSDGMGKWSRSSEAVRSHFGACRARRLRQLELHVPSMYQTAGQDRDWYFGKHPAELYRVHWSDWWWLAGAWPAERTNQHTPNYSRTCFWPCWSDG